MKSTRYNSVTALLRDVSDDNAVKKQAEERIAKRQLAKSLFSLRCSKKMTQADLAEKLNCSQGRISKIEHAEDGAISIQDILDYCEACGMRLQMSFVDRNSTNVDRVKHHWFAMKQCLDDLCALAKGDKKIEEGVRAFTAEAAMNINFGLLACLNKLKPGAAGSQILQVSGPVIKDSLIEKVEESVK